MTKTVYGGSHQEAILHNLFQAGSTEWYRPTPLLVRLANAEEALAKETTDAAVRRLFAEHWHSRYPDGCQIVIDPGLPTGEAILD